MSRIRSLSGSDHIYFKKTGNEHTSPNTKLKPSKSCLKEPHYQNFLNSSSTKGDFSPSLSRVSSSHGVPSRPHLLKDHEAIPSLKLTASFPLKKHGLSEISFLGPGLSSGVMLVSRSVKEKLELLWDINWVSVYHPRSGIKQNTLDE